MYQHYTTTYTLKKGNETLHFNSEKDACKYLGVSQCSVASCYRRKRKCKGYTVERGESTTHMETKTRLHRIWLGMHERCSRPKHPHFKSYGGRGIKVCEEWKSYESFRDWALSNGYSDDLTIDRKDNDGNYEPSNCRWITIKEQAANKSTNHYITVNGENIIISECSRRYGIPKSTIRWREMNGRDILTGERMDLRTPTEVQLDEADSVMMGD